MDNYMSIAAMSVDMHQQMDATSLGTAVLKMAMDTQTAAMDGMIEAFSPLSHWIVDFFCNNQHFYMEYPCLPWVRCHEVT